MAALGEVILALDDAPGAPIWHERLMLSLVPQRPGNYVVTTPDGDLSI
jgi:hypothetical protein